MIVRKEECLTSWKNRPDLNVLRSKDFRFAIILRKLEWDKDWIHRSIPKLPSVEQSIVTTSWPFDMWGIDLIGPLPKGRGECEFIMVAIDYYTKWIKAKPLKDTATSQIIYLRVGR